MPVTSDGKKIRLETNEWYVRFRNAQGKWERKKGYTDKTATMNMALNEHKRAVGQRSGLADPYEDSYARPLSEHLADFEAELESNPKVSSEKHVHQVVTMATRIIDGCRFKRIPDIEATEVSVFLGGLRDQGLSVQTCKHHLRAIKQFCRWLMKRKRSKDNPVIDLEPGDVKTDQRRLRRALSADEIRWLLTTTATSETTFRGLDADDRYTIYYLALGSGLRASELASLRPESLHLDGDEPMVEVEVTISKRRKLDQQAIQPDLVRVLKAYLIDKPAG